MRLIFAQNLRTK